MAFDAHFRRIDMSSEHESSAAKRFLELIRGDSAYPIIRRRIASVCAMILGLGVLLLVGAACSIAVGAMASRSPELMASLIAGGAVVAVIGLSFIGLSRYLKERMSMQVDMADSLLRIGSRTPVVDAKTSRSGAESVVAQGSPQDLPALPMPNGSVSGAASAIPPAHRNASDRDDEGEARYMLIRAKDRIREGKRREAIELMREIVAQYPRTSSGQKAAAQLQKHGLG